MYSFSQSRTARDKPEILNQNPPINRYRINIEKALSTLDNSRIKFHKVHGGDAKFFTAGDQQLRAVQTWTHKETNKCWIIVRIIYKYGSVWIESGVIFNIAAIEVKTWWQNRIQVEQNT